MIRVEYPPEGGAEVETALERQPAVYLDHDSLGEIARNADRRRRFLDIWTRKGELLFSWANALDISGPQEGSAQAIKELLEAIGPHWVPLEINPWKVVRKESGQEPSSGTPCVSESFLNGYVLRLRDEVTNLGRVVDLIHEDRTLSSRTSPTSRRRPIRWCRHSATATDAIGTLDRVLPALPNDPARPAAHMLRPIERLVTSQLGFQWTLNDGIDFMHASVAATCADFLLLDRQWKRRVMEVASAKTYPWVFYRNELDEFLDAFEHCVIG